MPFTISPLPSRSWHGPESLLFRMEEIREVPGPTKNRPLSIRESGHDRYGRTLAEVILPDGRSLNQELLKAGLAWWFRKYSRDAALGDLEDEARLAKRGLWADKEPVPPWEWRTHKTIHQ